MIYLAPSRPWMVFLGAVAMLCTGLPSYAGAPALTRIVDAIVRNGPPGELPAHLSLVLGVNTVAEKVPVRQAVLREGAKVHTFNVCSGNHSDLVLIQYDEQKHTTDAYRLTLSGDLRKAVNYSDGKPAMDQPEAKARAGLAAELKFWKNLRMRPVGAH